MTIMNTGVDLSKILGANQNIGGKGSNNWWKHGGFSIIRGSCPGCPKSLRLWLWTMRGFYAHGFVHAVLKGYRTTPPENLEKF